MRLNIFYLTSIILLFSVGVSAKEKEYTIKGLLDKYDSPAKVYLVYEKNKRFEVDSCILNHGSFLFTGYSEYPFFAQLVINPLGNGLNKSLSDVMAVFVDSEEIIVSGHDSLSNAIITGSQLNALYQKYITELNLIEKEKLRVLAELEAEHQLGEAPFNNTGSLVSQLNILDNMLSNKVFSFTAQHSQNMLSVYLLQKEIKHSAYTKNYETAFSMLSESLKHSKPGQELIALIEKYSLLQPGNIAPRFTALSETEKTVNPEDFRGKYLLIFFWTPECSHCKDEITYISKFYNRLKNKGFEVLAVGILDETNGTQWKNAIADLGIDWINITDLKGWQSPIVKEYKVRATPTGYLLNPDGVIIDVDLYRDALFNKLTDLLK